MKFIHELGESKFKGKRIVDYLDVGDGFSIWWMTLLAEKNPLKSPCIYDCIRLLALEEIFKESVEHYIEGEAVHGNGSTVVDLREAGGEILREGTLKWPPSYC